MKITNKNWKNKVGTSNRSCKCKTWKQHWLNGSNNSWPNVCSISGCSNTPTLGAHIINSNVSGERVIPACDSCNKLSDEFNLKEGVILVLANKSKTCNQ